MIEWPNWLTAEGSGDAVIDVGVGDGGPGAVVERGLVRVVTVHPGNKTELSS